MWIWKKNPKFSEFSKVLWTKLVWSCSKFAQINFRQNKYAQFSSFLILLKKRWKKIRFKFEIFPNFELESDFFPTFFEQNHKTRKYRKFILSEVYLSQFWARSEHLFFRKKRPLLEGVFEKKIQNFPNFPTWNRIFFRFKNDFKNFRKLGTFICRELHMSEFSAKSENLFREGGRLVTH